MNLKVLFRISPIINSRELKRGPEKMNLIQDKNCLDKILLTAREFVVRESTILINEDTVAEHISLTKELNTLWKDSYSEKVDVLYTTSREYPLSEVRGTKRKLLLQEKYIEKSFKLTREEVKEYMITY